MPYKVLLAALLGLSLTGCAVYGGGYDHAYRGHDRYYAGSSYQVQRYPVYVAPRHYGYDNRRYDRRHFDNRRHDPRHFNQQRHDQRRYLPAPPARFSNHERHSGHRIDGRRDQRRHDYRDTQQRRGWNGQRFDPQERTPRYQRHDQRGDHRSRGDRRRGMDVRHN
jgi:hypothetical protein